PPGRWQGARGATGLKAWADRRTRRPHGVASGRFLHLHQPFSAASRLGGRLRGTIPVCALVIGRWRCSVLSSLLVQALAAVVAAFSPDAGVQAVHSMHAASAISADAPLAPRLSGLGDLHHPVSTSNEDAQAFFDQGLRLLYAFNHPEALRAFQEAARLDPSLAMAYWGQAMALSPNLNAPMTPENGRLAYAAIQEARARAASATPVERGLIEALAARFSPDGEGDAQALGRAYADAMRAVAAAAPDDTEVLTLLADALMNTM